MQAANTLEEWLNRLIMPSAGSRDLFGSDEILLSELCLDNLYSWRAQQTLSQEWEWLGQMSKVNPCGYVLGGFSWLTWFMAD